MSNLFDALLSKTWFGYLARTVLTFMFWSSGFAKLMDFGGTQAEMAHFGLEPTWLYAAATIITQIAGSVLIVLNRWTWVGAGALAVFTALCIPIAHDFWNMQGQEALNNFRTVTGHISVIGGLMVVAYASVRKS